MIEPTHIHIHTSLSSATCEPKCRNLYAEIQAWKINDFNEPTQMLNYLSLPQLIYNGDVKFTITAQIVMSVLWNVDEICLCWCVMLHDCNGNVQLINR